MLTINIRNDGIGPDSASNYRFVVEVNGLVIAVGEVKNHNRADGWRELVRRVVEEE